MEMKKEERKADSTAEPMVASMDESMADSSAQPMVDSMVASMARWKAG